MQQEKIVKTSKKKKEGKKWGEQLGCCFFFGCVWCGGFFFVLIWVVCVFGGFFVGWGVGFFVSPDRKVTYGGKTNGDGTRRYQEGRLLMGTAGVLGGKGQS